MAHKALRGSRTTYGDIDPINDLEQLRKCENRRRAASVGENLDDNPRLLKGPYDSFGSALVKSGLLCEDACGEDGHSEQVWRDGLFELDDVLDNALSRTIRTEASVRVVRRAHRPRHLRR